MKIFKVTCSLDSRGFYGHVNDIEVEEKKSSFVGEGYRISKDKIMKIDTIFFENSACVRYHTYCHDGDVQKSIDMLKQHIKSKVEKYSKDINILLEHVNKLQ